MTTEINSFQGNYRFLSNFYPCKVVLDGIEYPSVEHAYQAAKTNDLGERERIRQMTTPGDAKRAGARLKPRMSIPAWNTVRTGIMYGLLRQKFSSEPLRTKLLDTGDAELVEGNWWRDTFWGKYNGIGENRLGIMLMIIRGVLKEGGE